ncbi:SWI/SNF and RSC complex subunit Ssr3 [Coemansia sp. RSA 989]|nr:SWI/SNF and RSC complex subunit Ssr3 [Coemansia sp. RSA 989]KAJ1874895.1 SWI/SNF and RSC complex subunit Ssr3 [Coemansia sp. RSA 990]KAJ2671554.1 SWI/SNF and RSC complex subunit Ssr3 [Coemansia sp. RSA 1085]
MATPNIKRKRLVEKSLPPKIETYIPESRLFTQLQALERRLDTKIVRKRLEVQEALGKPVYKKRVLRIFVSNLAANQSGAPALLGADDLDEGRFGAAEVPSWTLRVEGRLLDPSGTTSKARSTPHKFSEFLNSLTVELERNPDLYKDNLVQWRRAAAESDVDGFEIKRRGDEDVKTKIILDIRTAADRFKVNSPLLRELLDIRGPISKAGFIMKMWQYIKFNNLQDSNDPDQIRCDVGLAQALGSNVVSFTTLPQMLHVFLTRPDPLVIEYTVRVNAGDFHMAQYAFDVEVEIEETSRHNIGPLANVQARHRELAQLENQLAQKMEEIHNARTKRDFLRSFAEDPVAFVHRWIDNQTKDLEVILGDRRHGLEAALSAIMAADSSAEQMTAERQKALEKETAKWLKESALYDEPWADEAVFHYLSAKTQERMQQLLQAQHQQGHAQQQQQQQQQHSALGN